MMKLAVLHAWLMVSSLLMVPTTSLLNLANTQCGVMYPKPNSIGRREQLDRRARVLNGTEAYEGEFPWLVSIKIAGATGGHFCGGAVIHERLVLTAAHCFSYASKRNAKTHVKVVIGEHKVRDFDKNEEILDVIEVITHVNYTKRYVNDIALIVLAKDILWAQHVQPVCLPDKAAESDIDDVNWTAEAVTVAGWGLTDELANNGTYPNILQSVIMAVVPRDKCEMWLTEKVGKPAKIYDTHYCAGIYDGHKDTCRGDDGGPLLLADKATGQRIAVGIVSTGIGCGREGLPGIYSRVARYISWILEHKENIKNTV